MSFQIAPNEIIDACLTRTSISPIKIQEKLTKVRPIDNPELIVGEWEVIASLMTWQNKEDPDYYTTTFGYGEYRKEYTITYEFLNENKGTRTSDGQIIDIEWKLTDSNKKLYTKNNLDLEEEIYIRMNADTIELLFSNGKPYPMYLYNVLKRIK